MTTYLGRMEERSLELPPLFSDEEVRSLCAELELLISVQAAAARGV